MGAHWNLPCIEIKKHDTIKYVAVKSRIPDKLNNRVINACYPGGKRA
jgi:hypothetical protein